MKEFNSLITKGIHIPAVQPNRLLDTYLKATKTQLTNEKWNRNFVRFAEWILQPTDLLFYIFSNYTTEKLTYAYKFMVQVVSM
jgi:hypothetical protein